MEVLFYRNLLEEIGYKEQPPSIIYTDSQSAIDLIKNGRPTNRSRAKHIKLNCLCNVKYDKKYLKCFTLKYLFLLKLKVS